MLAQALSYAPNVNVAILSAARLMQMLDRVPQFVAPTKEAVTTGADKTNGNVRFADVEFSYPTRRDVQVLKRLNLHVQAGKTVALVGPSGCGKSTCIQLLLRYYDPDEGRVLVDGTLTTDYTLESLRSQIGLVSQEPVLFDRTIAENIAYGDNRRVVPMAEIMDAARQANMHAFITKLPAVGSSGVCVCVCIRNILSLIAHPGSICRATKRGWATAALSCPVVRSSALQLPGRWFAIRKFCCSTRPPRRWIARAKRPCRRRWIRHRLAGRASRLRIGCRPCAMPI